MMSLFLEPSYRKLLDFKIIFDKNEYFDIYCHFYRRQEECEKVPRYSIDCDSYVKSIDYGVDLWVHFPKKRLPVENSEVIFITCIL